jgi:hypothetical protein
MSSNYQAYSSAPLGTKAGYTVEMKLVSLLTKCGIILAKTRTLRSHKSPPPSEKNANALVGRINTIRLLAILLNKESHTANTHLANASLNTFATSRECATNHPCALLCKARILTTRRRQRIQPKQPYDQSFPASRPSTPSPLRLLFQSPV